MDIVFKKNMVGGENSITVAKISEADWLNAYPGNDPKIAGEGIAAFKKAVENNMHTIGLAAASDTLQ